MGGEAKNERQKTFEHAEWTVVATPLRRFLVKFNDDYILQLSIQDRPYLVDGYT